MKVIFEDRVGHGMISKGCRNTVLINSERLIFPKILLLFPFTNIKVVPCVSRLKFFLKSGYKLVYKCNIVCLKQLVK